MSDREKIDTALEMIRQAGFMKDRIDPDGAYREMKYMDFGEVAEDISIMLNLIISVRETLEGKE